MKRVVVTGGAGFIGSHLVDRLLAEGASVLVIDNFSTGLEKNLVPANESYPENLKTCKASICDQAALREVVNWKPDTVFHLAAQVNVRSSVAEPANDAQLNVAGTVNMLEAARMAGAKKFILTSTGGAIYGEQDVYPADESHPIKPESPYGMSKRAAELYLELYARLHSMCTVSLRLANVYGPRQNPKGEAGVVAIFCDRLRDGQALRINGDGLQTRDFVYVDDVIEAHFLSGQKSAAPGYSVRNVGRGVEITVLEIVDHLKAVWPEISGRSAAEITVENGPALPGEQRRSVIDNFKISSELNWNPSVSFRDGISRTVKSISDA
jgi:UDP-glucose 4-epimerase